MANQNPNSSNFYQQTFGTPSNTGGLPEHNDAGEGAHVTNNVTNNNPNDSDNPDNDIANHADANSNADIESHQLGGLGNVFSVMWESVNVNVNVNVTANASAAAATQHQLVLDRRQQQNITAQHYHPPSTTSAQPQQQHNAITIPPSASASASASATISSTPLSHPQHPAQQHVHPEYIPAHPMPKSDVITLVQSYDWTNTIRRIASHPYEASAVGVEGRTPLHMACDLDAPAVVVQALLAANPSAALEVGTSNMNPLHITCSSPHASVLVVRVMLLECSKTGNVFDMVKKITAMKDVDGDTPLHTACRCGAPIEVLSVLLQANPKVVHYRDYEELTPLLRLWVRYFVTLGEYVINAVTGEEDLKGELGEAWEKTLILLKAAYLGTVNDSSDELTSIAAAADDKEVVVEGGGESECNNDGNSVVSQENKHKKSYQMTPKNNKNCCGNNNCASRNELTLSTKPESRNTTTSKEIKPPPLATTANNRQIPKNEHKDPSKPESSSRIRKRRFLPLHAAASIDCPRCIVKIATKLYPDKINILDSNGFTPLMVAAKAPIFKEHDLSDEGYCIEDQIHGDDVYNTHEENYSDENNINNNHPSSSTTNNNSTTLPQPRQPTVIQILLEASADASRPHPSSGRIPINVALVSGKTWFEGVKTILEAHPDSLMLLDPLTGLYPFMLAATVGVDGEERVTTEGRKADLTTIYQLLRRNPESIRWAKDQRWRRRKVMREHQEEEKVVEFSECNDFQNESSDSKAKKDLSGKPK